MFILLFAWGEWYLLLFCLDSYRLRDKGMTGDQRFATKLLVPDLIFSRQ